MPISNPNPIPKYYYTKKKTYSKIDTWGLTAAELADRALIARERAEQAGIVKTLEESNDKGFMLIPGTPPCQIAGESQGSTTITINNLPIRTPKCPQVGILLPRAPSPLPLALTAPPTLGGSLGKKKRTITARYKQGREEGLNPSIGYLQETSTPR